MSYMLQFPTTALPANAKSPPFVLFGINDNDVFGDLPNNIPLGLVTHFAPALSQWIVPTPELSQEGIYLALRTPFVSINIQGDLELEGLVWILSRMMQLANIRNQMGEYYEIFMTPPSLSTAIAIHKAWNALELPVKGIDALHMHIQSELMCGSPVTLFEIKGIWHNFPVKSVIQREMGLNFARNYVRRAYTPQESSAVRHWYLDATDRWKFFKEIENQTPGFKDVPEIMLREAAERRKQEELKAQKTSNTEKEKVTPADKNPEADKHKAQQEQRIVQRPRSKTLESMSSVETVVWLPDYGSGIDRIPKTPAKAIASSSRSVAPTAKNNPPPPSSSGGPGNTSLESFPSFWNPTEPISAWREKQEKQGAFSSDSQTVRGSAASVAPTTKKEAKEPDVPKTGPMPIPKQQKKESKAHATSENETSTPTQHHQTLPFRPRIPDHFPESALRTTTQPTFAGSGRTLLDYYLEGQLASTNTATFMVIPRGSITVEEQEEDPEQDDDLYSG